MDEGADLIGMGRAAIVGNPDWPLQATSLSYEPERPPYTAGILNQSTLGYFCGLYETLEEFRRR